MSFRLALPWEVIETIINHSSDSTITLCSFALTCRQLYPCSSHLLYCHVALKSREKLFALCETLQAKPELRPFVQTVAVPLEEFSPFPLLSILPHLCRVAFPDGNKYRDLSSDVAIHDSTLRYCSWYGSRIRSLTIEFVRFPTCSAFLRLLSAFSGIEDLACRNVAIGLGTDSDSQLVRVQHRLSRQLHLKTLNVRRTVALSAFLQPSSCIACSIYTD